MRYFKNAAVLEGVHADRVADKADGYEHERCVRMRRGVAGMTRDNLGVRNA